MRRVAFTMFGYDGWTGGVNYLRNLLSALVEAQQQRVEPVLFVGPGTPQASLDALRPWLRQPEIEVQGWGPDWAAQARRLTALGLTQVDAVSLRAFRAHGVDAVFQHAAWYGLRFPLPTVGWIADFQHCHLPGMFSPATRMKRNLGYAALSRSADVLMVSSQDAANDCRQFFPAARDKLAVVPFSVRVETSALEAASSEVAAGHGLPARYLYMPNQLWKHKNHLLVVDALAMLKQEGHHVVVAASGNASDNRNPAHPGQVLGRVKELGLESMFRFLGLVPYGHILPLMRGAAAVLNPSLFEGWSTSVEEAKAVGVPLVLSNLAVHREQTAGHPVRFFDPHSPGDLAAQLLAAWKEPPQVEPNAVNLGRYQAARDAYADAFACVVEQAITGVRPAPATPT